MIIETKILNQIVKEVIARGNEISIEIASDNEEQYSKSLIKRLNELNLLDLGDDKELDKFLLDSAAISIIMMFKLKSAEEKNPKLKAI